MERTEGWIDVGPGRVWYESAGTGPALLLLHGGPGAPSDYLIPLLDMADDGYRVVRYDQLGSRRSDKPDDVTLWTVDRFTNEVETVRRTLGFERMHLLGQSWGAFLALEYALAHGDRLTSLVLYSGAASTAQCVAGMDRLRNQLPAETVAMMAHHESAGEFEHPDYKAAVETLYRRHLCRVDPLPALQVESMANMAKPVYETMWGPNEFTCTGSLLEFDRTDRLSEVTVPTLILCGRFDEVTPDCSETLHAGIAGSELVIFDESSHSSHFEQPDLFYPVLKAFLHRAETKEASVGVNSGA